MSSIAKVLLGQGYQVTGSDIRKSDISLNLEKMGARIDYKHSPDNLTDGEAVVYSSAIAQDNPELTEARAKGLPVLHRSEVLSMLMGQRRGIAIAGAHGKTSTSSLAGFVLEDLGLDPTIIIGGETQEYGNAKAGKGECLVAEADESDGSFMRLHPEIAIVTNVEDDHIDHYKTVEAIEKTFFKFINKLPPHGVAIICTDDPFLKQIYSELEVPVITYGSSPQADYYLAYQNSSVPGLGVAIHNHGQYLGRLELKIPGKHNYLNAISVVALGNYLGLATKDVLNSISKFRGVKRRFETIGEVQGVKFIDDYAHHPTEIEALLSAVRQIAPGRVIAVFQPHRYTRTAHLYKEFGQAFKQADLVLLDEIYSAGEQPITGVSVALIAEEMQKNKSTTAILFKDQKGLEAHLANIIHTGDTVVTIGAGDIWKSGRRLYAALGGK